MIEKSIKRCSNDNIFYVNELTENFLVGFYVCHKNLCEMFILICSILTFFQNKIILQMFFSPNYHLVRFKFLLKYFRFFYVCNYDQNFF